MIMNNIQFIASVITEDPHYSSSVAAYHITTRSAYQKIIKDGYLQRSAPRFGHVGNGIYVIFMQGDDIAYECLEFANYLDIDDPVVLKVLVDDNSLLMDEDSLCNEDILSHLMEVMDLPSKMRRNDPILSYLPAGAIKSLIEFALQDHDMDDLRALCTKLIDDYKIKPSELFKTYVSRSSYDTARSTMSAIPVLSLVEFNDYD
jgi:hypothetical protein